MDTTIIEKAIAFPTNSRLYFKALQLLVRLSKELGIKLRQTYKMIGHLKWDCRMGRNFLHGEQSKNYIVTLFLGNGLGCTGNTKSVPYIILFGIQLSLKKEHSINLQSPIS